MVADALREAHGWGPEWIEIVPITTSGDMIQDRPLAEVGGKGLWTKELDRCLIDGRTDMSVHSMKDVETIRPDNFMLAAMLRVGTSSPRRTAQLLARRPDLNIVAFRGNVATRLRRLEANEADAALLAAAGLDRLGHPEIGVPLDLLPAPSQGAIGVEMLASNRRARDVIASVDHKPTSACVAAERALLAALGGDCRSPIAALATLDGGMITLRAEILTNDGKEAERGDISFEARDRDGPARLARQLLDRAAPALRALFAGEAAHP
jgi:hydroxymethylbilane synthase